jgi:hypothetical protein
MARTARAVPRFGYQVDPQEVANVSDVADVSLFPATFNNQWCGEFK